jgi:hypothetical protein
VHAKQTTEKLPVEVPPFVEVVAMAISSVIGLLLGAPRSNAIRKPPLTENAGTFA